jgi:predicted HAD superfamily Cof-like phosphohydrolase
MMKKQIEQVKEFNDLFGVEYRTRPGGIPIKTQKQRIYLLEEEINELYDAVDAHDIVEIADAIVDIAYVLCGGVLEFGLSKPFIAHKPKQGKPNYDSQYGYGMQVVACMKLEINRLHEIADRGEFRGIIDILKDLKEWIFLCLDLYELTPIFEELFDEVHKTNMAKLHNGKVVKDAVTAKIQKPKGWQPPNLERIINKHFNN